jgi:hypothetical protein
MPARPTSTGALNYLAVRYPAIYAKAAEEFGRNFRSLEWKCSSRLWAARGKLWRSSYTNRITDFTEKFFVRVDVNRGVSIPVDEVVTIL